MQNKTNNFFSNLGQLGKRIITAIILIAIVLTGIFYLPLWAFSLVALILISMGAIEFSLLVWGNTDFYNHIVFMVLFLLVATIGTYFFPIALLSLTLLWWLCVPYFLLQYTKTAKNLFDNFPLQLIMGIMLFAPCLVGLIKIQENFGASYLLYILVCIWATDIGAYFAGRAFGKHNLAEHISPKKTIEGLIGGIILAILAAIIGGFILKIHGTKWLLLLTLVLVSCLWSVIGDLFESMLKRLADVKDSSNLLPGHGGVFDRIDSLTAAIPIFALGLLLFGG